MKKNTAQALTGILVGALFLALVARRIEWTGVGDILASSRLELVAPIVLLLLVHYVLKGFRWRVLLSGTADVRPWLAVRLTMVGFFMNNVFPARLGELGRPYLLAANHPEVSFSWALATVVGDKLFDLVVIILFLCTCAVLLTLPGYVLTGVAVLAIAAAAGLATGGIAYRWQRHVSAGGEEGALAGRLLRLAGPRREALRNAVLGFAQGISTVWSARRSAMALALSLSAFACLAGVVYLSMAMVHVEGSVVSSLFVIGMTGIGFTIPSPPTNAGNFHFFAATAIMLALDVTAEEAMAFALVSHIIQVLVVSLAGAAAMAGLDWRKASAARGVSGQGGAEVRTA
jgi:uncharacterized protein (TIRG00374 family)